MAVGGNVGSDGVADGTLSLRTYAIPDAAKAAFSGYSYGAGMITTEESHDQTYGYWETSFRINNLDKGNHLALWLLPQDDSWPPEVDILEIANNDVNSGDNPLRKWTTNTHGGGNGLKTIYKDDWQGWHTVGVESTPTSLKWIYDGVVVREEANYVHKPMYFTATWEVGSNWPGATNQTTISPSEVEFDYVRAFTSTPGKTSAGAPAGYSQVWGDEFNTPSIGTDAGDKFAPYFTDWGVRSLANNNDKAIKIADDEMSANGKQTYGEALAATGVYGDAPYFHHYNNYAASPPAASPPASPPAAPPPPPTAAPDVTSPPPSSTPSTTTLKVAVSGDAHGNKGNGGPEAKMALFVDGVQVEAPVKVTASHGSGQWQTLSFDTGVDLSNAHSVGVKFTNDWANWTKATGTINGEDRNLYVDFIQFGDTTLQAEQGKFSYASGGGAKGSQLLSQNGTLGFDLDSLVHNA